MVKLNFQHTVLPPAFFQPFVPSYMNTFLLINLRAGNSPEPTIRIRPCSHAGTKRNRRRGSKQSRKEEDGRLPVGMRVFPVYPEMRHESTYGRQRRRRRDIWGQSGLSDKLHTLTLSHISSCWMATEKIGHRAATLADAICNSICRKRGVAGMRWGCV